MPKPDRLLPLISINKRSTLLDEKEDTEALDINVLLDSCESYMLGRQDASLIISEVAIQYKIGSA